MGHQRGIGGHNVKGLIVNPTRVQIRLEAEKPGRRREPRGTFAPVICDLCFALLTFLKDVK
jgi:hypothetical protein